jgi:hypothetical protein
MSPGRSGISFKVSKGNFEMMHFHEDPNPESNRAFWFLMFGLMLLAMFFIMEIFIKFYLQVT